ncbi:ABC transporter substrate-binding protein [Salibacterium aidingense]|uniref:ABC transporter substrate-binding protein n=1 Tax=Salibacterium aidingense TaxID=384933 RepID=UPI000406C413|nr:glycine betaine ABC transporter substrate-binding protein [Salibacterium aidingense]
MKKVTLLLLTIVLSAAMAACGGGGKSVTVGAKNFTEQFLLSQMTVQMLEANDFEVEENNNMGSTALREALVNRQVDLSWDYTGTALITYMEEEPAASPEEAYEKVQEIDAEENDLVWSNLSDINNTYTVVMREEQAQELGIASLSDLADYVNENPGEITIATDAEFGNRPDGLPGVEETYGFEFGSENKEEMTIGLTYEALNNDEVQASVGFATDPQIDEYDLISLEDDQQFFPSYNAAVSMTQETYDEYPEIEEILQPLAEELDDETMRELNYRVDIEEENVADVAQDFLQENGFIE